MIDASTVGEQQGSSKTQEEMAKTIEQIALVKRSLKQARQAKNVLRVMLGLEIALAKGGSDANNFPVQRPLLEKKAKRKSGDGQRNGSKVKIEEAPIGNRSITRSMHRCNEKHNGSPGRVSDEQDDISSQDYLELTLIETLIILVMCQQGIPIWSEEMSSLFAQGEDNGDNFILLWNSLGDWLVSVAQEWFVDATKKVEECQKECDKYAHLENNSAVKARVQKKFENATLQQKNRKTAVTQAEDYARDVTILAKKSVMLIERLRKKMGNTAGGHTKPAKKANYWLGNKALGYLQGELFKWAKSLDIVDSDGSTLAYTAADFFHDLPAEEKALLDICSIVSKQECRQILIQITSLSRLRSLYLKYSKEAMEPKIIRAVQNAKAGDTWDKRPLWWRSPNHDVALLCGLLENGLNNILSLKGFGPPEQVRKCSFRFNVGLY